MTERTDVLIVGAGPVGLVLACELRHQGVAVRVVDRRRRAAAVGGTQSRAILIWPRILEQLRRIGVSHRMVELGHLLPAVDYFSSGRLRGTVHIDRLPDTAYPFILTLAQNDTEAVLLDRLRELGGEVEGGVELTAVHDPEGDLAAELRHDDGTTETVRPGWLVGADGAGSTTRGLLDITFAADPIDITYGIGDFPIDGPVPNTVQYYYSRTGIGVIVPLKNGMFRIAGNIPHRAEGEQRPPAEMYRTMISQRTGLDIRLGDPLWTNSFRPRCGVVQQYRRGRCFLAGDAAHVVSPAGGQGMNIGLQDAVELGWKLGGVVAGRFGESILDSYEPERRSAARRVADTSAAQIRFGAAPSRWKALQRDTVFAAADRLGVLQRRFAPLLAQTDFTYGDEPGGALFRGVRVPAQVGDRLPVFAPPAVLPGLPALDLHDFTVLLWPGDTGSRDWPALRAQAHAALATEHTVHDLGSLFGRAADNLRRLLGGAPAVVAVRPDGHIAAKASPAGAGAVTDFLRSTRVGLPGGTGNKPPLLLS
ncbi:FAD-dependent monooxygenase [Actinokineospora fastidiosa]|uniref:Oxygenase n=1 Tax=Actinokineospora fastidiosa TaxID=1816 RepID=A0A918LEE3_9PSEU|nr:FAD-dependent monooxygenase [Actinokineospora fastidiosa]GGS37262.1 oxygenase [Actinokineospora fastidiosa]